MATDDLNPSASDGSRLGLRARMRLCLAVGIALMVAVAMGAIGLQSLLAAGTPKLSVSPQSVAQVWYRPTPFSITINASDLSGGVGSPVAAYQYGLTWNPNVLQWVSGPQVGPGTPTPAPVLPCSNNPQVITWGTPTFTPTNFIPTFTPTATNTPGAGTPTNTPTATYTASMTPTPGGYILIGCASISGTAVASGVVGTFQFRPIQTAPASSQLHLRDVEMYDHNGNPITPTSSDGFASFVICADLNGDGHVNGLDLSILASHFLMSVGNPNYLAIADLNNDGSINGLDLAILAASFLQTC